MKRLKLLLVSLAVVSLCAVPGITWAAAIAIDTLLTNPSFELGTNGACPTSWSCSGSPGAAAYTPTAAQFVAGSDGIPGIVPNGNRAGYAPTSVSGSGTLRQDTLVTFVSGNTYSFTFWVGTPLTEPDGTTTVSGPPPFGNVSVLITGNGVTDGLCGGSACRFDVPSLPARGQWKQYTYSPVITQGFGQAIGVQLLELGTGTNGQEINWDIGTPVPEPATMFLGGLGLIAFGYAARRRLFGR